MENKKVKGATPLEYNGIRFKSKLEVAAYKVLTEEGFNPEYEKHTYKLQDSELFPTPVYTQYRDRKLHKNVWGLSKYKVIGLKYTPDFIFSLGSKLIVIEIKGYQNDRYPYQKKLFLKWLKENKPDSAFFEIHNNRQLKAAIEIIKTIQQSICEKVLKT